MSNNDKSRESRTPYQMVMSDMEDQNPVDVTVRARLPQTKLRKRIRELTLRMAKTTGKQRETWVALEPLLNQYRYEREEMYFNLGYEYGVAAGRGEAFHKLGGAGAEPTRALIERLRWMATEAGLPTRDTVAAIVETAWVFALGIENGLPDPADDDNEGSEER